MLDAGMEELSQHHHGEPMREVLEAVYYAMACVARARASSSNPVR